MQVTAPHPAVPWQATSHAQASSQVTLLHERLPAQPIEHAPVPQLTVAHESFAVHATSQVPSPQVTPLHDARPVHWTLHAPPLHAMFAQLCWPAQLILQAVASSHATPLRHDCAVVHSTSQFQPGGQVIFCVHAAGSA